LQGEISAGDISGRYQRETEAYSNNTQIDEPNRHSSPDMATFSADIGDVSATPFDASFGVSTV